MIEEMVFDDLAPIEVPVKIAGKRYVLVEASEEAASAWQNAHIRGAKVEGGKMVGVGNIADSQAILISGCLFEVIVNEQTKNEIRKQVPLTTVKAWRRRITKPLFEKAKEISELEEKTPATEKALVEKIQELQTSLGKMRGEEPAPNGQGATLIPSA